MSCGEIQDRLPDRAAGRLESTTEVEIDRHLAGCAECRELFAVVRSLEGTRPAVPAGLEARILADVRGAAAERAAPASLEPGAPGSGERSRAFGVPRRDADVHDTPTSKGRRRVAPVNDPASCPNSSVSSKDSASAAQFSLTKGRSQRGDR